MDGQDRAWEWRVHNASGKRNDASTVKQWVESVSLYALCDGPCIGGQKKQTPQPYLEIHVSTQEFQVVRPPEPIELCSRPYRENSQRFPPSKRPLPGHQGHQTEKPDEVLCGANFVESNKSKRRDEHAERQILGIH
eukprot:scaffold64_cov338-Pavlova_lutheri.AAC.44